uniref:Histone acetyltransferase n=1 Tax=Parascaris equorum TaxID=6256 RepID=A0A914RAL3_PAREQ
MTRSQRRIHEEFNHLQKSYDDMDATTAKLEKEHAEKAAVVKSSFDVYREESFSILTGGDTIYMDRAAATLEPYVPPMTKVKNIELIRYGDYEIDAWYVSPYPAEYGKLHKLWICEYCMAYMKSEEEFLCHMMHYCDRRQPPGDEIYRKGNLSVFEVDGRASKGCAQECWDAWKRARLFKVYAVKWLTRRCSRIIASGLVTRAVSDRGLRPLIDPISRRFYRCRIEVGSLLNALPPSKRCLKEV